MQVTVVIPNGKIVPGGGEQMTDAPGQLSLTVRSEKLTSVEVSPKAAVIVMLAGQVIAGGSVS